MDDEKVVFEDGALLFVKAEAWAPGDKIMGRSCQRRDERHERSRLITNLAASCDAGARNDSNAEPMDWGKLFGCTCTYTLLPRCALRLAALQRCVAAMLSRRLHGVREAAVLAEDVRAPRDAWVPI